MMYEMKQVCILKLKGLSDEEVRQKIMEENIFQQNKMASAKRALPYILKRVAALDDKLKEMLVHEPHDVGKVINLYSIMKTDRFFFEFMNEVVRDRLKHSDGLLERKDVNLFFAIKAEESTFIAGLAESTTERLKQTFTKILLEVGILKDLRNRELQRIFIDDDVKKVMMENGDAQYINAMGEYVD